MHSMSRLIIVFFLIAIISLSALSQASQESVITVGPQGCDFYRREAALDSAGPGDIIEVQSGEYVGEDDIVRFEDNYGRA